MEICNAIENACMYCYVPSSNNTEGGIAYYEGTIEQIRNSENIKKWKARFTDPTGRLPITQIRLQYGQGEVCCMLNPETREPGYFLWLPKRDDAEAKIQFEHYFLYWVSHWVCILDDFSVVSNKEIASINEEDLANV